MLAHGYKTCFWKANGDLDCSGQNSYNNRQSIPEPYRMFSTCGELGDGFAKQYNPYNNSYFGDFENRGGGSIDYSNWTNQYDMVGGATFYADGGSCDNRVPSGPRIASGGFDYDAQWVSPEYYQPPRDSDTPRNNFNHGIDYDSQYFNPEQKYATYYSRKSQRGGSGFKSIHQNGKKSRFTQSKLPKAFYKKRGQYGGGFSSSSNALIPYGSRNNTLLATSNISPGFSDRLPTQYTKDEFLKQKYGNSYGNNYNYNQYNSSTGGGQYNIYSSNPYNSTISQYYGDEYPNGGYYDNSYNQAIVPKGMSYEWNEDLSYRDGSNIIPAQDQYENMLNNYKQADTYGQTDFDYVGQMQQGWRSTLGRNIANEDNSCYTCQPQGTSGQPQGTYSQQGNYGQPHGIYSQQGTFGQQGQQGTCQNGGRYNFSQYGGADATFARTSQPQSISLVSSPFYSRWQCPNGTVIKPDPMDSVVGHRDCEGNPNLTLNIGNNLSEAFETPLFQGGGGILDNDGYSQYSPSYSMLLQQDWNNLQPKHAQRSSLQLGGGARAYDSNCQALVKTNVMPSNSYGSDLSGAPISQHDMAYKIYEVPYDQQEEAPREVMWIPKVQNKLRVLSRELGAPYLIDRNANGFAVWNQSCLNQVYAGVFKRVELHDEMIPCTEPFKHYRNLYTWVRMDISPDQLEKLQIISPNITYDMTKRWLCVSGSSMRSNLAIVTLVCMYLQNKLSLNQIQGYKLQKKYLMALMPRSGIYHPDAKSTFVKTIKLMTK